MKITETLYVINRDEWRKWLSENHATKKEIWLISYSKNPATNHLFFTFMQLKKHYVLVGLMVSQRKFAAERSAQRFTPRRAKSNWTELNKERAKRLIQNGRMTEAGLQVLPDLSSNAFQIPKDILEALQTEGQTWDNFSNFLMFIKEFVLVILKKYEDNPVNFKKGSTTS